MNPVPLAPGLLLTLSRVAAWLEVEPKTVRRWVAAGQFPQPIEFNKQRRWRSDTLLDWSKALELQNSVGFQRTLPDVQGTLGTEEQKTGRRGKGTE